MAFFDCFSLFGLSAWVKEGACVDLHNILDLVLMTELEMCLCWNLSLDVTKSSSF